MHHASFHAASYRVVAVFVFLRKWHSQFVDEASFAW
jgi:hypothetical protein